MKCYSAKEPPTPKMLGKGKNAAVPGREILGLIEDKVVDMGAFTAMQTLFLKNKNRWKVNAKGCRIKV